jgi:putative redox protein
MENNSKAVVHYAAEQMLIGISPGNHAVVIDTKSENKSAPTPIELLMIAVGSCTAIDVAEILRKKRQIVTAYRIEVSGERREEHPRSFSRLFIHHVVTGSGIAPKAVEQAIKLSDEKYCSVVDALRPKAEIVTSFEIVEAENA